MSGISVAPDYNQNSSVSVRVMIMRALAKAHPDVSRWVEQAVLDLHGAWQETFVEDYYIYQQRYTSPYFHDSIKTPAETAGLIYYLALRYTELYADQTAGNPPRAGQPDRIQNRS